MGRPFRRCAFLLAGRTGRERRSLVDGRSMAGGLGCATVDATIGTGAGRGVARGAGVVGVARGSDAGVLGVPGSRESTEPGV